MKQEFEISDAHIGRAHQTVQHLVAVADVGDAKLEDDDRQVGGIRNVAKMIHRDIRSQVGPAAEDSRRKHQQRRGAAARRHLRHARGFQAALRVHPVHEVGGVTDRIHASGVDALLLVEGAGTHFRCMRIDHDGLHPVHRRDMPQVLLQHGLIDREIFPERHQAGGYDAFRPER